MALKSYFDGSKAGNRALSLASIASTDDVLEDFERQWRAVLADRGNAPYMHMREAMSLKEAFDGWSPQQRDWLVHGLRDLLAEFAHYQRFRAFTCTVDLVAYNRWRIANRLPPAARLCVRSIFRPLIEWYAAFPDLVLEHIELYFDRNEPFVGHLKNDWSSKKFRLKYPIWGLIRSIGEADMRMYPALQAADMIAWARNRLAAVPSESDLVIDPLLSVNDTFSALANLIFFAVLRQGWHVTIHEHILATRRFAE